MHPIDNLERPENSSSLKEIRKQMLEGVPPAGCMRCKEDESSGILSKRMRAQKWITDTPNTVESGVIRVMEFSVGNSCNSRCLMCSSHLSSAWNFEVEKIGHEKSLVYSGDETRVIPHLSTIRELEVIGGETFLGDHLKRLLKAVYDANSAKDIVLKMVTNLSIFPNEETLNLLRGFKRVELFGSVDGFKERNTFIRYPTRWEKVEQNARRFLELSKEHPQIYFSLTHTSSALSFGTLPDLLEWWEKLLKDQNVSTHNRFWFNSVVDPPYQALPVLPLEFRTKIVQQMNEKSHLASVRKALELKSYFLQPERKSLFDELLRTVKKFQYRSKIPLEILFPELYGVSERPAIAKELQPT